MQLSEKELHDLMAQLKKLDSLDSLLERMKELEDKVDEIRLELPTMRLVRSIVFSGVGLVAATLLTAILALVLKKGN